MECVLPQVDEEARKELDKGTTEVFKDMYPFMPGALKEFKEQADLIPAFAKKVAGQIDPNQELNPAFQKLFCELGPEGFSLVSLEQWLELMAVTGLMHGCTLSMTRGFFTKSGLSYMSKDIPILSEDIF